MGDIEIIGDLQIVQPVESAPPMGSAQAMGVIKPEDMRIFLPKRVLEEIWHYSTSRTDVEVGGMLVGSLRSYRGVNWIDIKGYLQVREAVQNAASWRMTHDACAAAERERDSRFNDQIFVGWHHTHPRYGVFLSSTDMFTCRSYFNLQWMVALVVDPCAEELGFFQWKNGRMEQCGFYFTQ